MTLQTIVGEYICCTPEQDWLLPPRVDEESGAEHLVFFLHQTVERLDLSAFERLGSDGGRPAYAPQMLVKVWLYAYATGLISSRRLERRLREDLGFRFLAGNLKPGHWTLSESRRSATAGIASSCAAAASSLPWTRTR